MTLSDPAAAYQRGVAPSLLANSIREETGQATLEDEQDKSQSQSDWAGARSHRARSHAASFAISIATHAMAIAAILYFAPALSKPHSDWVLAYLVDVREGSTEVSQTDSMSFAGMLSALSSIADGAGGHPARAEAP